MSSPAPERKWEKPIKSINRYHHPKRMLYVFLLSTLENPSRHVLTRPQAKVEKIDKIKKSIPISPKTDVIFVFSALRNPSGPVPRQK
ncbi:hypothetical protein Y032_0266g715 [Ancylostoma ceylanicum]|uniref:Uncharacterized protein n=1 Tax=Ancylostoma ceylanicum TaxID=53326 RepID=A0A016SA18_9BILA|nr:hypothetical protein Y032_0266g715 [Ancylostoma ceylanicum]